MNRRIAATLVALSIALGIGTGFLLERMNDTPAGAEGPRGTSPTPTSTNSRSATPSPTPSPEGDAPRGPDGKPLKLTLHGIGPVKVGDKVFEHMRSGYLVADQDPPCDGNHWLWSGGLSRGLLVSATQDGTITALGVSRAGYVNDEGLGIGSTLQDVRDAYGEFLNPPEQSDQGVGWAWVSEQGKWLGYAVGPINEIGPDSKVEFIEVGKGDFQHHFDDAC